MTKAKKDNKAVDFEASLARLEALVERMEGGELSLEESLKAFEEGIGLTRKAQQSLAEAEQKVQLLLAGEDGPREEPFHSEDEDGE